MEWSSIKSFSDLLSKLRNQSPDSQSEIADEIGIKSATLSHLESGRRNPTIEVLLKILDFFGLEIIIRSDFGSLKLVESDKRNQTFEFEHIEDDVPVLFQDLPEDEIEDIYSFIQRRRKRHSDYQDNA